MDLVNFLSTETHSIVPCRNRSPLEEQIARRRFPRVNRQLWLLLQRGTIKYIRAFWPLRIIDSLLLLVAAFIIGEHNKGEFRREKGRGKEGVR